MTNQSQHLEEVTRQAVREVFQSMVSMDVTPEAATAMAADLAGEIVGSVGFVGGVTSGVIYLYTGVSFARTVTSRMLGIPEVEVDNDEMINDAIGELSNMVAGCVKSNLGNSGHSCQLTIPSVVRGQKLSVESSTEFTRKIIGFRNCNHHFLAELLLKESAK